MADYKRFVSYLYAYQNNIKSKNSGFCRVELRDHNCRLEVYLKLPIHPFTPTLKVYAFVPSNQKLYGIFLGNASYQQGNVSGSFSFAEKNIQGSSYQFSQLGGIFIQTDIGVCFASAWKDFHIQPDQFVEYQKNSNEKISNEKISNEKISNECNIAHAPKTYFPIPNAETTPDQSQTESDQQNVETLSSIPDETEDISDTILQDNYNYNETELPKEKTAEVTIKQETPEEAQKNQTAEITIEQERVEVPKQVEHQTKDFSKEESCAPLFAASMDSSCSKEKEDTTDNFWETILKTYPKCHPFFDDEIYNCVQLSKQDLHLLSSSGYPICNNGFFRHNYESFQHFLIGKKSCNSSPDKAHYILAVPGIYNTKEQYMASMFGFPYFKCSQNFQYRNNCWGYWYRIIPEHWNHCKF